MKQYSHVDDLQSVSPPSPTQDPQVLLSGKLQLSLDLEFFLPSMDLEL